MGVGAQKVGVLQFQLRVPLHAPKVLMLDLVEKAAVAVLVRHTPGAAFARFANPTSLVLMKRGWGGEGGWGGGRGAMVHRILSSN